VTASGGIPAPLAATVEAAPASGRPAAEDGATPSPAAPDHDDRAVRLALGWASERLRLMLVRDALKECCPADRDRILNAIGREDS
jgi:hypothetical protein